MVFKTLLPARLGARAGCSTSRSSWCNLGKRAAVVYSQNDLAGAWSRDESGDYDYEVSPGGEPQRELAIRLGINVCMYALCLDYKDDAVHLPLIMKKRR